MAQAELLAGYPVIDLEVPDCAPILRNAELWLGHRQVVDLVWWQRGLVVVAIAARYKGYRYPIEVIGHAVWLYHRFALSLRDVEELMLAPVSWSPTRRSGPGVRSSARTTPPGCVGGDPVPATSGTSTRSS